MEDAKEFSQNYFNNLKIAIDCLDYKKIQKIAGLLADAYQKDSQIFICGNGGSATTASHFACDLAKGTVKQLEDEQEKRIRVVSLTDNVANMTAIGNDLSYEDIFYQQLRNLVNENDIVIGISASGNSPNVIKAMQYAKRCKAITIGLLGFKTGGKLHDLVDYEITVQDNSYGRVEDVHLALTHLITAYLADLKK